MVPHQACASAENLLISFRAANVRHLLHHAVPMVDGLLLRLVSRPAATLPRMFDVLRGLFASFVALLRTGVAVAAEIAALRHQLAVLGRDRPTHLRLNPWDRALWAFVLQRWSGWRSALVIVRPETVIAWHRKGFRLLWRWRSRAGRPSTRAETRALIRRMAAENPIWGATRIHGELLKLGYRVSERTVSRYLERIRPAPMRPRSQTWGTSLRNQAKAIVGPALHDPRSRRGLRP